MTSLLGARKKERKLNKWHLRRWAWPRDWRIDSDLYYGYHEGKRNLFHRFWASCLFMENLHSSSRWSCMDCLDCLLATVTRIIEWTNFGLFDLASSRRWWKKYVFAFFLKIVDVRYSNGFPEWRRLGLIFLSIWRRTSLQRSKSSLSLLPKRLIIILTRVTPFSKWCLLRLHFWFKRLYLLI